MKRILLALLIVGANATLHAALSGAESLTGLIAKEFDTNSDDLLDAGEWQSGVAGGFARLDANADGSILPADVDGLKADIASESGHIAAALIVVLIQQVLVSLDTDGDKTVSRKEYDELSLDVFGRLDADKSNSLTLAEIAELPVILVNANASPPVKGSAG